jgi:hypothetical protein
LDNEGPMYDFNLKVTPTDFTTDALRRDGVR